MSAVMYRRKNVCVEVLCVEVTVYVCVSVGVTVCVFVGVSEFVWFFVCVCV